MLQLSFFELQLVGKIAAEECYQTERHGLKYKPDEALKYHARLVDAMKSLEKGKKIVQLVQKSEDQITDEKLLVDNDPVSFPSRFPDLETDSLKKPGENENSPLGPSMSWNIKQ